MAVDPLHYSDAPGTGNAGAEQRATTRAEEVEVARLVRRLQWARRSGFEDEARRCFARLDARYRERIIRLAELIVHNRAEAEAVANAALLRAWDNIDRYRPVGALAFWFWLRAIAVNRALSHLKTRRQEPTDPFEVRLRCELLGPDGEPRARRVAAISAKEAGGRLRDVSDERLAELLAAMPEGQRRVLDLRFELELDTAEIAVVLDCSEANVRSLQSRALARLRDGLAGDRGAAELRRLCAPMLIAIRPLPVLRARRFALWETPSGSFARSRF